MRKKLSLIICLTFIITSISGLNILNASASGAITDAVFKQYIPAEGSVTNIAIGTDRFITPGFSDPVYKTGEGAITNPAQSGYYSTNNMISWFKLYGDTNAYQFNYLYNVPDYLKNSTYIRLNRGWRGDYNDTVNNLNAKPSQTDVFSFKINKTAIVYYIYPDTSSSSIATNAPWLTEDGWTVDSTVQFVESNGTYQTGENPQIKNYILLKKVFYASESSLNTIHIGGFLKNYFVPMIYVRWVEDPTELASLSNVKFKQYVAASDSITNINVDPTNIITTGFTAPVYKTGAGAITDPTQSGYYSTNNMTSWFKSFTDTNYSRNNYFYDIPDYIKDATYIRLTRAWREPRTNSKTPNAMNAQSEVLTFDINNTANIYYVFPNPYEVNVPDYSVWLIDENWQLCEERVQYIDSTGDAGENPQIYNYLLFKKKFIVEPGSTETIKIGGFHQNFFVPFVFIDWVNENTTKNINVSVIGNGKVNKIGNNDVNIGSTFTLTATPDEGYAIEYIKLNNNEVVSYYNGVKTYTTPAINSDAAIEVKFVEAQITPQITTSPYVFNYLDDVTNLPCGITFATAPNYENYTLVEYGIVFSKTDLTPTLEEGAKKYEGIVFRNDDGQYGIKLYGTGLIFGNQYYTTPYAIYEDSENVRHTVYGASTGFIPINNVYSPEV